jgi:hypothetical protein
MTRTEAKRISAPFRDSTFSSLVLGDELGDGFSSHWPVFGPKKKFWPVIAHRRQPFPFAKGVC